MTAEERQARLIESFAAMYQLTLKYPDPVGDCPKRTQFRKPIRILANRDYRRRR